MNVKMSDEKLVDDCWNTIGCWGDQLPRCSKLDTYGHCFNCELYSGAGRQLLNREAPPGYLDEWKILLNTVATERDSQISSLLIFTVEGHCFALPTEVLVKVTEYMPIHSIPHSRNDSVLGITNIVGELIISVAFLSLLKVQENRELEESDFKRNVVIKVDSGQWAIPVNEVFGIHKLDLNENRTATECLNSDCVDFVFKWQDKNVSFVNGANLSSVFEGIRF